MAEYKSFHYLMNKPPEKSKDFYVTSKPLSFDQLYSPRSNFRRVHSAEQHYWRTGDRILYTFYEDRPNKVLVITCKNVGTNEAYRTIFLDLVLLYFELEFKENGNREPLLKKTSKKLDSDAKIDVKVKDYLIPRLKIGKDPIPWPEFSTLHKEMDTPTEKRDGIVSGLEVQGNCSPSETDQNNQIIERMCVLERLSSDNETPQLEIDMPKGLCLDGIESIRLQPTNNVVHNGEGEALTQTTKEEDVKAPCEVVEGVSAPSASEINKDVANKTPTASSAHQAKDTVQHAATKKNRQNESTSNTNRNKTKEIQNQSNSLRQQQSSKIMKDTANRNNRQGSKPQLSRADRPNRSSKELHGLQGKTKDEHKKPSSRGTSRPNTKGTGKLNRGSTETRSPKPKSTATKAREMLSPKARKRATRIAPTTNS